MPDGQIVQDAKDGIAVLFVKGQRLKAHGIQMCRATASADSFLFGQGQESLAIALPPDRLVEPQDADVQPAPIRLAQQPAQEGAVGGAQKEGQWFVAIIRREEEIVGLQSLLDNAHVLG